MPFRPGSLLQPDQGAADHSITISGRRPRNSLRMFHPRKTALRGFRVPPFSVFLIVAAVDMLARIHQAMLRGNTSSAAFNRILLAGAGRGPHRDWSRQSRPRRRFGRSPVQRALYLRSSTRNPAYPTQSNVAVEKTAPAISDYASRARTCTAHLQKSPTI